MPSDLLFAQSEKVAGRLPELFSTMDTIVNRFNRKATTEMISERDIRVPLLTTEGGRPGTFNPNMGAFGRGSYQEGATMISTYFPWRYTVEMPLIASRATRASEQSKVSAFKRAIKKAVPQFGAFVDRIFHVSDGTARMSQAIAQTTTGGNTVYTMNFAEGVMPFRVGEYYVPYDSTLVTPRDAGVARKCLAVNIQARTLTMNGTVTGAAATDIMCFEGAGNIASPTGPKGLAYFLSTATSGNVLTLSRSTYPELVPTLRDAAGNAPTYQMGEQIAHTILRRRGTDRGIPPGLVAIMNTDQQANLRQQLLDMAGFNLSEGKSIDTDIMPKIGGNPTFAGVPVELSIHAKSDRVEYTSFQNWINAEIDPITFYEIEGKRFHTLYGGDGSPAAGLWFGLYMLRDWICEDPGLNAVIYGCPAATY